MKKFKLKTMIVISIAIIALLFLSRPITEKALDKINFYGNNNLVNFIDDEGVRVVMSKAPERIVCLDSVHTENLFSFDLDREIVGVDSKSTRPAEAAFKEEVKLGDDVEALISLNPDVVIITPEISRDYPEYINDVRRAGLNVVSLSYPSIDDLDNYFSKLGMISGKPKTSVKYAKNLKSRLDGIETIDNKGFNFYVESSEYGLTTYVDNSYQIQALKKVGGRNIASEAKTLYPGTILADIPGDKTRIDNVDVFVTVSSRGGNKHTVVARDEFANTKAIKESNIIEIPINYISTTESYFKGIEELRRFIYPEIYNDYKLYKPDLNQELLSKRDMSRLLVMYGRIPLFKPSRSQILNDKNHIYSRYVDVPYADIDFDYIETAVNLGLIDGEIIDDEEFFDPEDKVTRYEFALALFQVQNIDYSDEITIMDIDAYDKPKQIKAVINSGVMRLIDGSFKGNENMTMQNAKEILSRLDSLRDDK